MNPLKELSEEVNKLYIKLGLSRELESAKKLDELRDSNESCRLIDALILRLNQIRNSKEGDKRFINLKSPDVMKLIQDQIGLLCVYSFSKPGEIKHKLVLAGFEPDDIEKLRLEIVQAANGDIEGCLAGITCCTTASCVAGAVVVGVLLQGGGH